MSRTGLNNRYAWYDRYGTRQRRQRSGRDRRRHGVLHAGTARYVVTATVGSSRVGTTAIDLDLTSRQGGPVDRATLTIAAIMPLMGQAAQPVPAAFSGHGHYRAATVALTMAGPWELRLSVDAPDGVDHLTVPLPVTLPSSPRTRRRAGA